MDHTILIPALAFSAAAQFAVVALLGKRGMHSCDAITGALINIGSSMTVFIIVAPFVLEAHYWRSPALWIFAGIGLLRPSVSNMLGFEAAHRLGPTVSTTVESISPLFAVIGGIALLSEPFSPLTAVGALGVVSGVMVISSQGSARRHWPLWALLLPFGAALIRSAAHVGAKWGLSILPSVIFSGLVAYMVSFTVTLITAQLRKGGLRGNWCWDGLKWFGLAGLFNAGAIFSLNTALMLGNVSRVSPLIATYPLFTLLLSALFYRREKITRRTVLGVILVVPSVALVTLAR